MLLIKIGAACFSNATSPGQGLVFYFVMKGECFDMANANVSLQVIPRATGGKEDLYAIVDEAIKVIAESGVKYEVGPMETTMEGDYDELMAIVKKAQDAVVAAGSDRVVAIIKVDYCPEGVTMEEKVGKHRA